MFKDARLQERLFDQIHAVEFNMEDDFRNAEVGSILSGGFGSESFERVDDGETRQTRFARWVVHAKRTSRVSSMMFRPRLLVAEGFERISDDEEEDAVAPAGEEKPARRSRKAAAAEKAEKKKRPSKAAATKSSCYEEESTNQEVFQKTRRERRQ